MPLLNYTTRIDPGKTAMEIQTALIKARLGIQAVVFEYDEDTGRLTGLSFTMNLPGGPQAFTLPARIEKTHKLLQNDRSLTASQKTYEQAERTAWRVLKTWIEGQIALIQTGLADTAEVMFAYALTGNGRETLYNRWQEERKQIGA